MFNSPAGVRWNFLATCSESTLKSFILNCLNQIDMHEKQIAEEMAELAMWRGSLEAARDFEKHRPEVIEALRAEMMQDSIAIGPKHAEAAARKSEAA